MLLFAVSHYSGIADGSLSREIAQYTGNNNWAGLLGYATGTFLACVLPSVILGFLVSRTVRRESDEPSDDSRKTAPKSRAVWVVALWALCLAIIAYGLFYAKNDVTSAAFLAGYYIVPSLVVWGIFYTVFLRRRGGNIATLALLLIYASFLGSGLGSAHLQKQQALTALGAIQRDWTRLANEAATQDGMRARLERPKPIAPQASGEVGAMMTFLSEFMDRVVALRNDYLLELEAIGWNSILDAQRIKDDIGLVESKAITARAKAIVDKYADKTSQLMSDARKSISALDISEASRREMLAGFERGVDKTNDQMARQWKLEKDAVAQFENIVLLLAASKKWIVQEGKILFYESAELDRFNGYIAKVQHIMEEEQAIQQEAITAFNQQIESAKKDLNK